MSNGIDLSQVIWDDQNNSTDTSKVKWDVPQRTTVPDPVRGENPYTTAAKETAGQIGGVLARFPGRVIKDSREIASGMNAMVQDFPQALSDIDSVIQQAFWHPLDTFIKGKVDSLDNLKKTAISTLNYMEEKPVSSAINMSMIGGGAGKIVGGAVGKTITEASNIPLKAYGMTANKVVSSVAKPITKIPKVLENSSYKMVQSVIGQLPKEAKYGANAARAVVREGITGSLEDIAVQVRSKINEIQGIGDQLASKVTTLDNYSPAINVIDKKIAELTKNAPRTNSSTINKLVNAKKDLLGIQEDVAGNVIGQEIKPYSMTPSEALAFKRKYSDVTHWKGLASDDAVVNKTLQESRKVVKEQLNSNVPGLKSWNERYQDLDVARQATERTLLKEQMGKGLQNMINNSIRGGVGITTAGAILYGHPNIAIELLLGLGAKEVMSNPTLKTSLAHLLYKSSGADKSQLMRDVPWIKNHYDELINSRTVKHREYK